MITVLNRIIEFSFYALFFITPLLFTSVTSELFELNKMWFVYGITIVIATAWICKMILQKQFSIQRTPLDIPIALFLLSQIIATITSLDFHLSLWGYYSRFNGGLLSLISYVILYYAFVSNNQKDELKAFVAHKRFQIVLLLFSVALFFSSAFIAASTESFSSLTFFTCIFFSFLAGVLALPKATFVFRIIFIALFSGLLVTLWGIPSHFGYDPTCMLFRQSFDVSCWTSSFQPMIRIFSTFGQPNWLAAYLSILTPISLSFVFLFDNDFHKKEGKIAVVYYSLLSILFFVAILFTQSRSGLLALACAISILLFFFVWKNYKTHKNYAKKILLGLGIGIVGISLLFGTPFSKPIAQYLQKQQTSLPKQTQSAGTSLENGGTESGAIRLIVWKGALDIFKKNPLFGSGVETFAFSYYQNRPPEHNLTSEWDYLYNKAHNEYLNYLATTGIFGLGSYLFIIGFFLFLAGRFLFSSSYNQKTQKQYLVTLGLISGYISILVSNFWGFSVVVINVYFFLIPALLLLLAEHIHPDRTLSYSLPKDGKGSKVFSIAFVVITILIGFYLLLNLLRFWIADSVYAYGSQLSKAGQYVLAQENLQNAVLIREDEPVFQDDLAYNTAVLAVLLSEQNQASESAILANTALALSNNIVKQHPNYLTFLKTQVRILSVLSQINPSYLQLATNTVARAQQLAPTDAKVSYTAGVLYGQTGDLEKGIQTLQKAITLKPDYTDAYFALALLYREKAINDKGQVVNLEEQKKATDTLYYILKKIDPKSEQAQQTLKAWGEPLPE